LLAIIILGAVLRLYQIGSKGLWLDEAFSVWMGWQPVPQMFAWLPRIDQHPPLYYFLLHFWMRLGDSAAIVRTFSAFAGILTIPVVYFLGRRLAGATVGLIAAFLLAIAPFHVRFAQETRMYTLLTLNASLAMLALVHLLTDARAATEPLGQQLQDFFRTWRTARQVEKESQTETKVGYQQDFRKTDGWVNAPTQQRWLPLQAIATDLAWIAYILFTTATILSHNTATFFPLAINLFVFGLLTVRWRWPGHKGRFEPPSLKNWILAQIGVFLLWSPWLVAFVIQSVGVYGEFWIPEPTFRTVLETLKTFLSAFLPHRLDWAEVIWAAYGLVAMLGLVHFRRQPARLALLILLFLTPFVGEWLVSLRRPIFYDRTLIWASIPLYLLLAAGITQLRYRPYILVTVVIFATVNSLSLREYYTNFEKEQWDDAAAYVAKHVEQEDLILFNATWVQIPFDYYFRNFNRRVAEHGVPVDLFDRGILEPKMAQADVPRMHDLIRGRKRVWLIYSHNWYTDPDSIVSSNLRKELSLLDQRDFYGLEVRLYGVP
jgi:4-amino-4-deoxy-L-arabinose transferase-like glycosyltransferase